MELLEYIVRLNGAAVAEGEVQGLRRSFQELGAAAVEAGGKAGAGADAAAAGASAHGKTATGSAALAGGMANIAGKGSLALGALALVAVKMSNTFNTEMLKIQTEAGASGKELARMKTGVLDLAKSGQSFGAGPTTLAMGLYHLESMGIRGSKALLGLKLAAEEAAISGASLEDTTTSLGGAIFNNIKGTGTLSQTMGTLNAIAGAGNMRFQDLNEALGHGLLASAGLAHVSIQQIGAALDILTDSGMKGASAGAQLATSLHYLYNPTTKAQNALATIGLSGNKLAKDLAKPNGLLTALRDLRSHMHGLSSRQQQLILSNLLPAGRGRVLLQLYNQQDRFAGPKGKDAQIANTAGDFAAHGQEQARNNATKISVAYAKLQANVILFGNALTKYVTPALSKLVGWLATGVGFLTKLVTWFAKGSSTAKLIGGIILGLVAGFAAWVAVMKIGNIVFAIFDALMDANPIVIVIAAIVALAVGIGVAYAKVGWFRKGVNAVFDWLKGAVTTIISFVAKHWKTILMVMGGPFLLLPIYIATHFAKVVKFLKGAGKMIAHAASGMWDGLKDAFVAVINWIIGKFNDLPIVHGISILGHHIGGLPKITPLSTGGGGGGVGGPASATTAQALTKIKGGVTPAKDTPGMKVPWDDRDIVLKIGENDFARIQRKTTRKAMGG